VTCTKVHVHKHGETATCYGYGCRCAECIEGINERQFYYRHMKRAGRYRAPVIIPALGTHRRLQALAVLGWSASHVAARVGMSGARMRQIVAADRITKENAVRIGSVYEELWNVEAPRSSATNRTRSRARRLGWLPPMAWDDIDTDPEPPTVERDTDRGAGVVEEMDFLWRSGESSEAVAATLNRTRDGMAKLASRHGRLDLARWMERVAA